MFLHLTAPFIQPSLPCSIAIILPNYFYETFTHLYCYPVFKTSLQPTNFGFCKHLKNAFSHSYNINKGMKRIHISTLPNVHTFVQ